LAAIGGSYALLASAKEVVEHLSGAGSDQVPPPTFDEPQLEVAFGLRRLNWPDSIKDAEEPEHRRMRDIASNALDHCAVTI